MIIVIILAMLIQLYADVTTVPYKKTWQESKVVAKASIESNNKNYKRTSR